jgi:thymidylate synthase (FAD)
MRIDLLDHGYIEFIEAWGKGKGGDWAKDAGPDFEVGIIEAARQSTQGLFRGWERDEKLLTFLMEHKHDSPFEFAGAIIEVQAPIVVFREWHRHRTQSYNEMSGRYTELPARDYTPTLERLLVPTDGPNKQASRKEGTPALTREDAIVVQFAMDHISEGLQEAYECWLQVGVPKELARLRLPVARYSRMRASGNLRNWLAFLTLRMHPDAQWEIRQYANALGNEIIAKVFPHTWALFEAPGIVPTCAYTAMESLNGWETGCGNAWYLTKGKELYPYCALCGKKVEEVA